ncbi:hypothetical protein H312_01810 [Anncaliia algerae PRA339]|uniref:Uncharacterized protein n=1 Tax=Anncaliia algerae PRA339 TaxID=1288291 RepID=A0A059F0H3_9MICR|nr:hypothetical protein H312_01810 [Anncaliia algerae PRA339]
MPMLAFILLSHIFTTDQGSRSNRKKPSRSNRKKPSRSNRKKPSRSNQEKFNELKGKTVINYNKDVFSELIKFDNNQVNITNSKTFITYVGVRFSLFAENLEGFLKSESTCGVIHGSLQSVEEIIKKFDEYFDLGENKNSQLYKNYKEVSSDINNCKQKIYHFISLPGDESNARKVIKSDEPNARKVINKTGIPKSNLKSESKSESKSDPESESKSESKSEKLKNFKNELLKMSELLTKIGDIYENILKTIN